MSSYVATIGMFDGVHRGHRFVLSQVVQEAQQRGLQSLVITFDRQQPLLTPLADKRVLLSKAGIDRIEALPFTDALKAMTARQFMQQVLKEQLHVKLLLIGYDNRFGHNRAEGFDDYVRYGQELGIEVRQLPACGTVSSSLIRQYLQAGRVAEAAECLGHSYTIAGRVTHGEHIGTQLGFPTANIKPEHPLQIIPAPGAYAVNVRVGGSIEPKPAMMNIGLRPTFQGRHLTLEAHILHLDEDLYGQLLYVSFVERLRQEQRFDSPDALKQQLRQDAERAEKILKTKNSTSEH